MATPRPVKNYEYKYIKLFEEAGRRKVEIDCDSRKDALTLRRYLYSVRDALLAEPEVYPIPSLLSSLVRFRIEETKLIAEPERDAGAAIEEALSDVAREPDTGTEVSS